MKKSLVLAMAMALGVSATAFAANPFSDVPAGHWAYASVAKLAAAGIVDGYPDGTFKGDNLMTRYEMAQIVAKAYAKGAIGADDKLMAEFADELDNLGVRVAKLEKKADNVKITGEARFSYKDFEYFGGLGDYSPQLRTRLFLSGAVNDDWSYGAMVENTQKFDTNSEESDTKFRRAFVKGNMGSGVTVTAGRQYFKVGSGYTADLTGDAIKVDFGKVLKGTAFYGRFDSPLSSAIKMNDGTTIWGAYPASESKADTYGLLLSYDFGAVNAKAAYYNTEYNGIDRDIYTIGLGGDIAKNLNLYGEFLKASDENPGMPGDDGWAATLKYMGAKAAKADSWGMYVSYYDQSGATMIDHATEFDNSMFEYHGIKGYEIGADYTIAKNVVAAVSYYDFDAKDYGPEDNKMLWSRLYFTF